MLKKKSHLRFCSELQKSINYKKKITLKLN